MLLLVADDVVVYFLKKNQNVPRPSEHPPVRGGEMSLFLTFSVLVANLKTLLYTVVNPARGLLNTGKRVQKRKSRIMSVRHYCYVSNERLIFG